MKEKFGDWRGDAGRHQSERDVIIARIKAMEEWRQNQKRKIAEIKAKLQNQELAPLEKLRAERELRFAIESESEVWREEVLVARALSGGFKEAKDFLTELFGEDFFKRSKSLEI